MLVGTLRIRSSIEQFLVMIPWFAGGLISCDSKERSLARLMSCELVFKILSRD